MTTKKTDIDVSDARGLHLNLDADGREKVSNKSRVVAAHMPSLGERIRRYQRSPQLQSQLLLNPDLWDSEDHDLLDMTEGNKTSKHEIRYQNGLRKAEKLQAKKQAEAKESLRIKDEKRKEKRRAEIRAAIADGSITPDGEKPPQKGQ